MNNCVLNLKLYISLQTITVHNYLLKIISIQTKDISFFIFHYSLKNIDNFCTIIKISRNSKTRSVLRLGAPNRKSINNFEKPTGRKIQQLFHNTLFPTNYPVKLFIFSDGFQHRIWARTISIIKLCIASTRTKQWQTTLEWKWNFFYNRYVIFCSTFSDWLILIFIEKQNVSFDRKSKL